MASKFRQDMPPAGGYGPIEWAKKLPKKGLSGYSIFGIFFGVTGLAWAGYIFEMKIRKDSGICGVDFGIFVLVTCTCLDQWDGVANMSYFSNLHMKWMVEMNDARLALEPLFLAEEQRMYLTQLRKNRDEENELMKNVPGWETGKLNGEPVYHNINDRFPVVHPEAYFAHNKWGAMYDRYYERRKH